MTKKELKTRISGLSKWLKHHRHFDNWEGVKRYNDGLKAMYYRTEIN